LVATSGVRVSIRRSPVTCTDSTTSRSGEIWKSTVMVWPSSTRTLRDCGLYCGSETVIS
jgi:hypothetical protein